MAKEGGDYKHWDGEKPDLGQNIHFLKWLELQKQPNPEASSAEGAKRLNKILIEADDDGLIAIAKRQEKETGDALPETLSRLWEQRAALRRLVDPYGKIYPAINTPTTATFFKNLAELEGGGDSAATPEAGD